MKGGGGGGHKEKANIYGRFAENKRLIQKNRPNWTEIGAEFVGLIPRGLQGKDIAPAKPPTSLNLKTANTDKDIGELLESHRKTEALQ